MEPTETPAPQPDEPVATATSSGSDVSEASTQTGDAPEASQETKEPDVKAEETAETKLYAGKYKTVEELEKAYSSASSEASRISQEKAELSKVLNEVLITPETTPQTYSETDDEPVDKPDTSETDQLKRDTAILKFMVAHGDADGVAMREILASDPYISQISGYDAKLEYAHLRSQAMSQNKAIKEAEKKSAENAQVKLVEKQAAQVEAVRNQTLPADEEEELTQDELREKLRGDKSFDDLIVKRFPKIAKMRAQT